MSTEKSAIKLVAEKFQLEQEVGISDLILCANLLVDDAVSYEKSAEESSEDKGLYLSYAADRRSTSLKLMSFVNKYSEQRHNPTGDNYVQGL